MTKLNPEILTAAIEGFEAQKRKIDEQIAELRTMLSGGPAETTSPMESIPSKRRMSSASRQKMAIAQQARWAKLRGDVESPAPALAKLPKPKRILSAAGKKAIQEAVRRRWAQKSSGSTTAKSTSTGATSTKRIGAKKTAVKVASKRTLKKSARKAKDSSSQQAATQTA